MGRPSTDNTPVSGGQEDHVSMSATAAYQARRAVAMVRRVVAIELLCAVEATRYLDNALRLGEGTEIVQTQVRDVVPELDGDRPLDDDIDAIAALLRRGELSHALADAGLDIV